MKIQIVSKWYAFDNSDRFMSMCLRVINYLFLDSQGSHRIWDDVDDKVFVIPVFLEAFIRSFLSYHLSGDKPSTRNPSTALNCNATSDCGACSSPVADLYDVHQECILNVCLCPAAYYHLALDIGTI